MENVSAKYVITEALYKMALQKSKKNNTLSKISEALNNKEGIIICGDLYPNNENTGAYNNIYNKNEKNLTHVMDMSKDSISQSTENSRDMQKSLSCFAQNKEKIDILINKYEQEKSNALLKYDIAKAAEIEEKLKILRNDSIKIKKE